MGEAGDSTTFRSTEIATSKGGKLMRLAIRGTVKGSTVTLRQSAPCGTRGRMIGGITNGGRMFVYYESNRSNLSGSDIKGGNTGRTGLNQTGRRQGLDATTTRVYFPLAPGGALPFAPRGRP